LDRVVAEVFLREFADARRDSALQQAPVVSFSRSVPKELEGLSVDSGEGICYISFALFKRHWDVKAEATVSALCQFRNYLHYHIKCSKVSRRSCSTPLRRSHRSDPGPAGRGGRVRRREEEGEAERQGGRASAALECERDACGGAPWRGPRPAGLAAGVRNRP
jgi:hypothetical protein